MIELWAGLECTVNRVGELYFDQLARSGHAGRLGDIDRIAALGVSRLRYPVLWENVAPHSVADANWIGTDAFLYRLRDCGIRPIVGLMHHGSGPRHTDLLDSAFPEKLAQYAGAVAERYPWIDAYTPVNEPMVTARFAGLYGHWYPHCRNDHDFVRMVLNQCRGAVLAMQRIRAVNPAAQYVCTEDGGTTFSTAPLTYQASFENSRRDLALDLQFGRVDRAHSLSAYLRAHGVDDHEVSWFQEHRSPPDVIGIDYYATSDRYLDHEVGKYSADVHGGNGRDAYADVAAAGHLSSWSIGFTTALERIHARYGRPVALTEVHLGCTRDEQLRWLYAAWHGARVAERSGVDVRAVTSWALFGAYDWDTLVTQESGRYEAGAFDVRAPQPRPTAIAHAIGQLARHGDMQHAVASQPGWWARSVTPGFLCTLPLESRKQQPLLILGAHGTLGSAFVRHCESRGLSYVAMSRADVDITDGKEVDDVVAGTRPWAVINAAGFVDVDAAERDPVSCHLANAQGALNAAAACKRYGARLLTFSSDLVFDGERDTPYAERHATNALNVYGRSKVQAEQDVLARLPTALMVRTSAFFGPWDDHNFVTQTLNQLAGGKTLYISTSVVTPTYVPSLVDTSLDLLIDSEYGIWHLSNPEPLSWLQIAQMAGAMAGLSTSALEPAPPVSPGSLAVRPRYSALGSERGALMPSLACSLDAYLAARRTG